jgi:hypothetical protein
MELLPDMLEKLKIDKPFASYDEFIEHCVKPEGRRVSLSRPVDRRRRPGQLPGTWYR